MKKIALITLGLVAQQNCYSTEKNFINVVQKKLELSSPKEQFACHALGLFSAGFFYQKFKNPVIGGLIGGSIDFVVCPATINSYKWGKTKIKHYLLNHMKLPKKPKIYIKEKK